MRSAAQRGKLRRVRLIVDEAMPLLRQAGVIGLDDDADTVMAWLSASGAPRRIVARFHGGHRCDLRIRIDGSFTMNQSFNLEVAGQ